MCDWAADLEAPVLCMYWPATGGKEPVELEDNGEGKGGIDIHIATLDKYNMQDFASLVSAEAVESGWKGH